MRNLRVNPARIEADLQALAAITDPDRPWTRRAFSPRFDAGRNWLGQRFAEAGLAVSVDAGGQPSGHPSGQRRVRRNHAGVAFGYRARWRPV